MTSNRDYQALRLSAVLTGDLPRSTVACKVIRINIAIGLVINVSISSLIDAAFAAHNARLRINFI